MLRGRISTVTAAIGLVLTIVAIAPAAQGGDPFLATYRRGGDTIFWFAQISDTHINANRRRDSPW